MKIRPARSLRAKHTAAFGLAGAALVGAAFAVVGGAGSTGSVGASGSPADATTPIKHVVVLFPENISFDHYFGTYPFAANDGTGPAFTPLAGTSIPNNYLSSGATSLAGLNPALTTNNPNSTKPYRLTAERAWTCSQNHSYKPEQQAVLGSSSDGSNPAMDKFPESTNAGSTCQVNTSEYYAPGMNMAYYDGNTVTAMWNYAQHYAMSDNSWADNFGPSTVGALNLVSGQTYGAISYKADTDDENPTPVDPATGPFAFGVSAINHTTGVGTVISDPDPVYDDCANLDHTKAAASNPLAGMKPGNKNIGDVLSSKNLTWGWFQGGFDPTTPWAGSGTYAKCDAISYNAYTQAKVAANASNATYDYNPHHNPFDYYKSTSNPHHFPGTAGVTIGANDPTNDSTRTGANHQYDLTVFDQAAKTGNLPAVSFVKPRYSEDGHPNNSDPIDEQHFLVKTINELEKSPEWSSTAIVVAYDDSDGWYDHVAPKITNGSATTDDTALCSTVTARVASNETQDDRCGPSQRLPFLVISPYSKQNYIDHTKISQASIIKFIEQNWRLPSVGDGSFDATTGSIASMFDFHRAPQADKVTLNSDGVVAAVDRTTGRAPGHGPRH